MSCDVCFHGNFSNNPGDDLEAACGCDCHDDVCNDSDCPDCNMNYSECICYGDEK